MKKIVVIITILLVSVLNTQSFAQEDGNLGIFTGVSSYYGELNNYIPFYSPSYFVGAIYRHNFKYRYVFRLGVYFVNMRGSSSLSLDSYERSHNRTFSYSFGEVNLSGEFNFFRYDKHKYKDYYFSPYIVGGISFISVPDPYFAFDFSFPLGFGVKYALNQKVTIGAEVVYSWTYSDFLDRIPRDNYRTLQQSYNTNPDSYSLFGIFVTYQLFRQQAPCPVYTYF